MFDRRGLVFFATAMAVATAHASVYTVGADSACTHTTIAAAIAAAEADPVRSAVHIASNQEYTHQAITFDAPGSLDIVGGFANCSQSESDGSHAIIDGGGGATDPVFRITGVRANVRLSNLTIQHGDEDGSGKGGGIYYKGDGTLELNHCTITQNTAGYGGGIYVEATFVSTQLLIGEDVAIVGNTARYDGGGIVNDGALMTMIEPNSYIANNHAQGVLSADGQYIGGNGGGLLITGRNRFSATFIGSSGLGDVGVIYLNDARRGGGVALRGNANNYAKLELFSADRERPIRIRGNFASEYGGGVSMGELSGSGGYNFLNGWYTYFQDNMAPQGAAIDVRGSAREAVSFNYWTSGPSSEAFCPLGVACGGFTGNVAEDAAGQPSGGIIQADSNDFEFNRMTFEGNRGKSVFLANQAKTFSAKSVSMTGNTVSGSLIATDSSDDAFDFENLTIAGNSIADSTVLRIGNSGEGKLYRSIIWQPGKTTLHLDGDALDLYDDMVSERGSVDGGSTPYVTVLDPRFVDTEHGDYALRAASPAVDYTTRPSIDFGLDLYSNPHDVKLPIVLNFFERDLGAIERQTLEPLVLNSDFDSDLRLWSASTFGVTTWDATGNASGAAGSGSAHVTAPNAVTGTHVGGLVQCVQLPGPGVYALNGWGRGTGAAVTGGDIAELYWEYRKSGGGNCTQGAPDSSGTIVLSNANNWSRPATPAYIGVKEHDGLFTSSITVTLVAVESGPTGAPTDAWFDGITLGVDTILASGFESR